MKIVNMRFSESDRYVDEAEMAWYEKLNINKIIELVLLGAFALLVGLFIVRPIISVLISGARGTGYASVAFIPGGVPGGGGQMAFREEDYDVRYTTNEDGEEIPEYIPKKGVKSMINIDNIDGRVQGSSIKKIGEIVEKHPEEAINILRGWMYADK